MTTTAFPDFFTSAPTIRLVDPLADFLGAAADGVIDYTYADAVRLAGHSCPTVASAFLMTRSALRSLYPESLPERGGIRVELREQRSAGVTGVMAAVVTLITGATEDTGFCGIGGRFNRRHLLQFGQQLRFGDFRFTRIDSGKTIEVSTRPDRVAGDPRIGGLMPRCLNGLASVEEQKLFRELWQARVGRLLLEHADDASVIILHDL